MLYFLLLHNEPFLISILVHECLNSVKWMVIALKNYPLTLQLCHQQLLQHKICHYMSKAYSLLCCYFTNCSYQRGKSLLISKINSVVKLPLRI